MSLVLCKERKGMSNVLCSEDLMFVSFVIKSAQPSAIFLYLGPVDSTLVNLKSSIFLEGCLVTINKL